MEDSLSITAHIGLRKCQLIGSSSFSMLRSGPQVGTVLEDSGDEGIS
jgi:hypothetical protein